MTASMVLNTALALPSLAAEEPSVYQDATQKFSITIPSGWSAEKSSISGAEGGYSGYTGERPTVILLPSDPQARDCNISIVGTNISFEFTKLGSFGNVYAFASNLVGSQDRSNLLRFRSLDSATDEDPIQIAKLIDASDRGGEVYEVEYTVQKFPSPLKRHLFVSTTIGFDGKYNQLFTVTGQCREEDVEKYRSVLVNTVRTFKSGLRPVF
jgi:hypothetical protein